MKKLIACSLVCVVAISAVAEFADRDFSIADFGAKEGVKATDAFAAAMAECEKAGGGRVVVPKMVCFPSRFPGSSAISG